MQHKTLATYYRDAYKKQSKNSKTLTLRYIHTELPSSPVAHDELNLSEKRLNCLVKTNVDGILTVWAIKVEYQYVN